METIREDEEPTMHAKPQKEHEWLQKLVGEWTSEAEHEGETLRGTETGRSLDGLWVVLEGQSPMPGGGEGKTMITLGYDPQIGRYLGTWVGSMMNHLWIYDGELDAAGRVLTLEAEGPDMENPSETLPYRDVIEFKSDDYRTLTAQVLGKDGAWTELMRVHYRRKK